MASLVLKGNNRSLTISTDNNELLTQFITWLEHYNRFTSREGNSYIFPNDNLISICAIKARSYGLIETKHRNDFVF